MLFITLTVSFLVVLSSSVKYCCKGFTTRSWSSFAGYSDHHFTSICSTRAFCLVSYLQGHCCTLSITIDLKQKLIVLNHHIIETLSWDHYQVQEFSCICRFQVKSSLPPFVRFASSANSRQFGKQAAPPAALKDIKAADQNLELRENGSITCRQEFGAFRMMLQILGMSRLALFLSPKSGLCTAARTTWALCQYAESASAEKARLKKHCAWNKLQTLFLRYAACEHEVKCTAGLGSLCIR